MERIKWTDKIKNAVMLQRVGEGRIMLELIRKRKINWLGHWFRTNCLLKDVLDRRYGKWEDNPRQKKISDDRQHYDKWTV